MLDYNHLGLSRTATSKPALLKNNFYHEKSNSSFDQQLLPLQNSLDKHINLFKNKKKDSFQQDSIWDCCTSFCQEGEIEIPQFNLKQYYMIKNQNPKRRLINQVEESEPILFDISQLVSMSDNVKSKAEIKYNILNVDRYLINVFQPLKMQQQEHRIHYNEYIRKKTSKNLKYMIFNQ